jgi:phosphatidylglycerophosphate synthase
MDGVSSSQALDRSGDFDGARLPTRENFAFAVEPQSGPQVHTAVIFGLSRADEIIYGKPLLERILLACERAGSAYFIVQCAREDRAMMLAAAGRFRNHPGLILSEFGSGWQRGLSFLDPLASCIAVRGNLVFSRGNLRRVLEEHAAHPEETIMLASAGGDPHALLAVGPLVSLLDPAQGRRLAPPSRDMPFALNGRSGDRDQAELRMARSMREETVHTDGFLAQLLDRRLSWHISRHLAHTAITPNQVTLCNTALGLFIALLFASTAYWTRLLASVLLVISVTLDGVDGELARLKMVESEAGRRLDVLTDNIIEVAVFAGLLTGCYRASGSPVYFYLLAILLVGFGLCAISVNRALSLKGAQFKLWIERVEQYAGRDFAYLLLTLALFGRLSYFAWATAFGTWIFAIVLWIMTSTRLRRAPAA